MTLSWKAGRVSGIDVFLHPTLFLLPLFLGMNAASVAITAAVFGCVLLHELGHALTARRFGIGTLDITLYPIGGVARLTRMPKKPGPELLIALAGPAVNLAIAAARQAAAVADDARHERERLHVGRLRLHDNVRGAAIDGANDHVLRSIEKRDGAGIPRHRDRHPSLPERVHWNFGWSHRRTRERPCAKPLKCEARKRSGPREREPLDWTVGGSCRTCQPGRSVRVVHAATSRHGGHG